MHKSQIYQIIMKWVMTCFLLSITFSPSIKYVLLVTCYLTFFPLLGDVYREAC
jgi:hypothetical protein